MTYFGFQLQRGKIRYGAVLGEKKEVEQQHLK